MMLRITLTLVLLLAIVAAIGYVRRPAPPRGIDLYQRHYLSDSAEPPPEGAVKITFLGNTTLLIDDGTTRLLIDGFFTRPPLETVRGGTIATDTATVDAVLSKVGIDRVSALLVTHSHYDHVLDAAYVARRTGAKLCGSVSTLNVGRGGGLPESQIVPFEVGKDLKFGSLDVTALPSRHAPMSEALADLGQTIDSPLPQPAHARDYKEGGTFDLRIRRGARSILIKASAGFVAGAWDSLRTDILLLGVGSLGLQDSTFRSAWYDATVRRVRPDLVIPIGWDDFFSPLAAHLDLAKEPIDRPAPALDFLIARLAADHVAVGILQGYHSITVFGEGMPGSATRP